MEVEFGFFDATAVIIMYKLVVVTFSLKSPEVVTRGEFQSGFGSGSGVCCESMMEPRLNGICFE